MHTPEEPAPTNMPDALRAHGVFRVLGDEGRADSATDPKLPLQLVQDIYRAMVRTRVIDQQLERLQRQGRIGFHIGSVGEEACILASAAALRPTDWLLPCYREFGALLWRGFPLQTYVDNMFGNIDDPVQGRQMPDHYTGRKYRFGSVSSPIGTQMTQAVGMAWAAKKKGRDEVVGVFFGDGATSSADFHTAMNFAGVFETPTLFLCRNNRWAISLPSEQQTAAATFAEKGVAYGVHGVRVDGNDALATYRVVREAANRARAGGGPTLIELMTYRVGGHSTSDDPRAYRVQDEVERWRRIDPIKRLREHLVRQHAWDEARERKLVSDTEQELKRCIEASEGKKPPPIESMFEGVFDRQPWHLREQQAQCVSGPRAKARH